MTYRCDVSESLQESVQRRAVTVTASGSESCFPDRYGATTVGVAAFQLVMFCPIGIILRFERKRLLEAFTAFVRVSGPACGRVTRATGYVLLFDVQDGLVTRWQVPPVVSRERARAMLILNSDAIGEGCIRCRPWT
jgi:hypothetical protein